MKLVEILAREWNKWPVKDHYPVCQDHNGKLFVSSIDTESGETLHLNQEVEPAEDMSTAEVTLAQWEAERAQANAEAEREQRAQYEQELWDRAALGAQVMIFEAAGDNMSLVDIASHVALWADAFMAERAKRLKGGA